MRKCCALIGPLVLAACGALQDEAVEQTAPAELPPPVEARSSVDKAVATTGDVITYEVVVEHNQGVQVDIPDPADQIAGFRIVDLGTDAPVTKRNRVTVRRWYTLRADLVGSYILPPVRVTYREEEGAEPQSLTTSEIFVEVKSVLPQDGEATDIRDIKPLEVVERPFPWTWVGAGAIALVILGALMAVLRRRKEPPAIAPPPPHELAFAALGDLRHTNFEDPAALRRYYFQISEVIRTYVEGRFHLNATDLTTEEILRELNHHPHIAGGPRHKLEGFLVDTDRVKFAGYVPSAEEIQGTYERALSFVEETVPPPPQASDPSRAGAA